MQPDFDRDVYCLFGLPFDVMDINQAERKLRSAIERRTRCFLSTPNLNFLIACRDDAAFRDSVISSDLVVADGMPLLWLARLLGIPIRHRVAGASLFEKMRLCSPVTQVKVYFFGGPAGVAKEACQRINSGDDGMKCVGYMSPGFGSIDSMSDPLIIQAINDSNADFLVVSLGARKGQAWLMHNLHCLHTPVISHLGAVVNFVAGGVKRAPYTLQCLGLEWLWRIKEEPKLWRRYFDDGLMLVHLIFTKVLPSLWFSRVNQATKDSCTLSTITLRSAEGLTHITLEGAWGYKNLKPLREAFQQTAGNSHANVKINLRNVKYIDNAFLGLVLIMNGYQKSIGNLLTLEEVPHSIARIITLAGAHLTAEQSLL